MDKKPIHDLPPARLVVIDARGPNQMPRPMSPEKRAMTQKFLQQLEAWRAAHPGADYPPTAVHIVEAKGP